MPHQLGVLNPVPSRGRLLFFDLDESEKVLEILRRLPATDSILIGIGSPVAEALGQRVPGLHAFPSDLSTEISIPSTQAAMFAFLQGQDAGSLVREGIDLENQLRPAFRLEEAVDIFRHQEGRDLSGYVDGTENPDELQSPSVALIRGAGEGMDLGSFVTVQRWSHDLREFSSFSQKERDHIIGRRQADNEELNDAPLSAHVKRTAQESFTPEAFLVRRSMPYSLGLEHGLMFISFAATLSPFEAQMKRMVGREDGVTDALFRFSSPQTGAHFFCPPTKEGHLNLHALTSSP